MDESVVDYQFHYYHNMPFDNLKNYQEVFVGNLETESALSYFWSVYQRGLDYVVQVRFDNHPQIKILTGDLSKNSGLVNVYVESHQNESIEIDPYIHPLGVLLSYYLIHWNKGVFIHASGIINDKKAYIFTGVSGIGKSTMAGLWKQCGHAVVNDDRLIIRIEDDVIKLYNNPMPYLYQDPAEGILDKIFILNQSKENYIKPLSGVAAFTKVLANFIQQLYEPNMVKTHLNYLEQILKQVSVYEVGFKPDVEIVELIKKLD